MLTQLTYSRKEERGKRKEGRGAADQGGAALGLVQAPRVWSSSNPQSAIRNPQSIPVFVRPARIADMREVEPLINGFAEKNLMLPKSPDQLARNFREFVVATDADGRVVGCGALRVYSESLAEIVSLAVHESAHGSGVGGLVVERLLDEARALEVRTAFALTLRDNFFHRLGFETVSKELFPLKVWADCRNCPKLHACDEIAVAKEL
jgi:amino-acid N-acetyltransferase